MSYAASAGAIARQLYLPWGEVLTGTLETDYGFTGQKSSSFGLMYYVARYYDPALGVFTQPDTIVPLASQGVQAWNRYAYVNDSPTNHVDPSGHACEDLPQGSKQACINARNALLVPNIPDAAVGGDPTTPFELGVEWLTGTGSRNHEFRGGDPFTELLRQHDYINDVRDLVAERISLGDYTSYREDYSLSGIQGVPKYIKDYSTLATGAQTGNLAVTYLGTYSLRYYVTDVDFENRTAQVLFNVQNSSTLASGTRPPVLGYTPFWTDYVEPAINFIVRNGPMSRKTQDFWWTETITYK